MLVPAMYQPAVSPFKRGNSHSILNGQTRFIPMGASPVGLKIQIEAKKNPALTFQDRGSRL